VSEILVVSSYISHLLAVQLPIVSSDWLTELTAKPENTGTNKAYDIQFLLELVILACQTSADIHFADTLSSASGRPISLITRVAVTFAEQPQHVLNAIGSDSRLSHVLLIRVGTPGTCFVSSLMHDTRHGTSAPAQAP